MNADDITYEHEEDGVWLLVTLDDGYVARIRVQDCAEELYDRTKAAIGPWLRERDEARASYRRFRENPAAALAPFVCRDIDESGGYDVSDPKHPLYHSTHADIWDAREGK